MNWIRAGKAVAALVALVMMPGYATADSVTNASDPASLKNVLARVAVDMYSPQAKISLGALPQDLPPVPLPDGVTLLASIDRGTFTLADKRMMYETANPQSAMDAYVARLKAAGWVEEAPGQAGFVPADVPEVHSFCGKAPPARITVTRPTSTGTHALDVIVQPYPAGTRDACSGRARLINVPGGGTLPRFIAPPGASITINNQRAVAILQPRVSATIVAHEPIDAVLKSLSAQMISARWQPVEAIVGRTTASATFAITDERGRPLMALISLYGEPGHVDTYIGSTEVTDLTSTASPS